MSRDVQNAVNDLLLQAKSRDILTTQVKLLFKAEMERQGVSRAEMARRLGTTRSNVTQFFSRSNFSLMTMVGIAQALGLRVNISLEEGVPEYPTKGNPGWRD